MSGAPYIQYTVCVWYPILSSNMHVCMFLIIVCFQGLVLQHAEVRISALVVEYSFLLSNFMI